MIQTKAKAMRQRKVAKGKGVRKKSKERKENGRDQDEG